LIQHPELDPTDRPVVADVDSNEHRKLPKVPGDRPAELVVAPPEYVQRQIFLADWDGACEAVVLHTHIPECTFTKMRCHSGHHGINQLDATHVLQHT
jgi:hypothetical protein